MNPSSLIEILGVGAASYWGLFLVLATWVYIDAFLRGANPWPPALGTFLLGWVGLVAYLSRRPELAPEPVPVPVPVLVVEPGVGRGV